MTQQLPPSGSPVFQPVAAAAPRLKQPAGALQRALPGLVWVMALLLPAHVFMGRIFLGVGGWMTIMYGMFLAPVLLVLHLVVAILVGLRAAAVAPAAAGRWTSLSALGLWGSVLLLGIAGGDAGDALPAVPSPLERWGLPEQVAGGLNIAAMVGTLLFAALVLCCAIVECIVTRQRRTRAARR